MAVSAQMDLLAAMHAREVGVELVLERQSRYKASIDAAILFLAERGEEFGSDDVRQMCGDAPPGVSSNTPGACFIAASKAGLIRAVGFGYSARVVGHHNLTRRWVGVR